MSFGDFIRKFRAWLNDDVAARNEMGGNRSMFGRPEWEATSGGNCCSRCGQAPFDIKRVFDQSGRIIGLYCVPCARREGHM